MLEAKEHAEPHITWIVGKGKIDAQYDKWCAASVIQTSTTLTLNTYFNANHLSNEIRFKNLLGYGALNEAEAKNLSLSSHVDTCSWDLTYSGIFSLKSAWELIRKKGFTTLVSRKCWQKQILQKISIFLWKMLNNCLPYRLCSK